MSEKKQESKPLEVSGIQQPSKGLSAFANINAFENAQRMAKALCQSSIVPKAYQGNVPNTIVALEMAHRIGISPIMVMQNLDIIQGKPSWRSTFIISAINSCGRFTALRFEFEGEEDSPEYGCRACATDLETSERICGPKVTWKMVRAEGWDKKFDKNGNNISKWLTMPELMFQYRAASFFGRLHTPDILTGMHSVEEIIDINNNELSRNLENVREQKEIERIKKHISNSQDINTLDQVYEHIPNEEVRKLYDDKKKELINLANNKKG